MEVDGRMTHLGRVSRAVVLVGSVLVVGGLLGLSGCLTTGLEPGTHVVFGKKLKKPSQAELRRQVNAEIKLLMADARRRGFDIPITISDRVIYFINFWQTRARKHMVRYLERMGRYGPAMRRILRQHGLPEDLVYMALIESGFNCQAQSWAAAVGPWQFIRRTGIRFGLRVERWVDERRDPIRSTHAAAEYLKYLYNMLGTWYLAAAAYNAGEGTILGALKAYEAKTFWEIARSDRNYLRQETRDYVPKLIAAALIAKNPAKYGFTELNTQPPLKYDVVKVRGGTDLEVVANLCGIEPYVVFDLNPQYRLGATPPFKGDHEVRIPKGRAQAFMVAYAEHIQKHPTPVFIARPKTSPVRGYLRTATYRLRPGDTLWVLAKRFNVGVKDLMAINGLRSGRRLRPGRVIHIPGRWNAVAATRHYYTPRHERVSRRGRRSWVVTDAGYRPSRPSRRSRSRGRTQTQTRNDLAIHYYVVKKGDSLWTISRRFGVHWKDVLRWNNIRSHRRIRPGRRLVVYEFNETRPERTAPDRSGRLERRGNMSLARSLRSQAAIRYRVRKGDNIWVISRRFKVPVAKIRRWNNLSPGQTIYPGDMLVLQVSGR
jgi:membrane-bound lytic murein transglycosylase D